MSVVLFSDSSGQPASDEHQAFDLSAGRTLQRLSPTSNRAIDPPPDPAPEPPHPTLPPPPVARTDVEEPPRELPASTYLPASG